MSGQSDQLQLPIFTHEQEANLVHHADLLQY